MCKTSEQIIANLKQCANAQTVEGIAKFGSRFAQALGVSIPTLRKMARERVCAAGRLCEKKPSTGHCGRSENGIVTFAR